MVGECDGCNDITGLNFVEDSYNKFAFLDRWQNFNFYEISAFFGVYKTPGSWGVWQYTPAIKKGWSACPDLPVAVERDGISPYKRHIKPGGHLLQSSPACLHARGIGIYGCIPTTKSMSGHGYLLPLLFLCLLLAAAGCSSLSAGDVTYGNNNLTVAVTNGGAPVSAGVQVRIFALDEFGQHELLTTGTTATLAGNGNAVRIPVHLEPGNYKIYVYVTKDGQRQTAVIRDITV